VSKPGTMDANENVDRDDFEAVLVLPSGERISIRNLELGITHRIDGVDIFVVVEPGGLLITFEGELVYTIRVRSGDKDSNARWKHVDLVRNGATKVDLTKPEWSRGNPDDIRTCREELLSVLEVNRTLIQCMWAIIF
jgi:hypothetical protein